MMMDRGLIHARREICKRGRNKPKKEQQNKAQCAARRVVIVG
jgi:hypothetical protein